MPVPRRRDQAQIDHARKPEGSFPGVLDGASTGLARQASRLDHLDEESLPQGVSRFPTPGARRSETGIDEIRVDVDAGSSSCG